MFDAMPMEMCECVMVNLALFAMHFLMIIAMMHTIFLAMLVSSIELTVARLCDWSGSHRPDRLVRTRIRIINVIVSSWNWYRLTNSHSRNKHQQRYWNWLHIHGMALYCVAPTVCLFSPDFYLDSRRSARFWLPFLGFLFLFGKNKIKHKQNVKTFCARCCCWSSWSFALVT